MNTDQPLAGWIKFPSGDAQISGYLARPNGPGRFPTLLVQPEDFVLAEDIPFAGPYMREVVHRFVGQGYVALAVDHYSREGRIPGDITTNEGRWSVLMNVPDRRVLQDLDAALEHLGTQEFVDPERLGIVGFCQGGLFGFLMAAHSRRAKAAVAFYGQLFYREQWNSPEYTLNENKPAHPIEYVPEIACPVLCLYGGQDHTILPEHREQLREDIRKYGKEELVEIVVYENAKHAFFNHRRQEAYHPEAAQDAWERTVAFLEKHL